MRRGSKVIAASPPPLPRRVLRSRFGADWRRRVAWLCALAGVILCVVYLERTKVPLPASRASTAKETGPSWAAMVRELQAMHADGLDLLRQGTEDGSALAAYSALPPEQRDALLERGIARLRQEPLILRLAETPADAHDLMLKIAPELTGVPETATPDVATMLQGLLDGTENVGVLPPVEEPADRSAAAVAAQQVALLRHEIRSTILLRFAMSVLLPGDGVPL